MRDVTSRDWPDRLWPVSSTATEKLMRQVLDMSLPNRLLTVVDPDSRLPAGHPAAGKGQIDGTPTAYLCAGLTCSAPVRDPDALQSALEATVRASHQG